MTIPEAAMPVVEVLRKDVPRPTTEISATMPYQARPVPGFDGKCPMGLHPTAKLKRPVASFKAKSPMRAVPMEARREFYRWWDSLTLPEAREAVDLIWDNPNRP